MRKLAILLVLILGGVSVWYGWLLWQNNRPVAPPDRAQLLASLDRTINWLENNRGTVEDTKNHILFWMLKEAAEISGNSRLISFYQEYKTNHIDTSSTNLWSPMFDTSVQVVVPPVEWLYHLPDYNLLFLYGLTCDRQLGEEPDILRQLDPEFCHMHFLHPRCVTHQLFGVRFMQRSHCGNADEVAKLTRALQDTVVTELTWDPRVGDAYIQRLVILMDSGAAKRVKPIWIQHVLEAQNVDGGWGDLDPIIYLPDGQVFAFSSTMPVVDTLHSNFHATSQGIWLISLLLYQHAEH